MNPIEFARNLFLLRREHRMTIEDLAAALEVTPELICEWECAKTSPSLEQMNRLAKIYGIPLADIIRTPKPVDHIPEPEPEPEPMTAVPEPDEPEKEAEPTPEEPATPERKRPALWEIVIIALLVLIIAAALIFLLKPEWFPLRDLLGTWSVLKGLRP